MEKKKKKTAQYCYLQYFRLGHSFVWFKRNWNTKTEASHKSIFFNNLISNILVLFFFLLLPFLQYCDFTVCAAVHPSHLCARSSVIDSLLSLISIINFSTVCYSLCPFLTLKRRSGTCSGMDREHSKKKKTDEQNIEWSLVLAINFQLNWHPLMKCIGCCCCCFSFLHFLPSHFDLGKKKSREEKQTFVSTVHVLLFHFNCSRYSLFVLFFFGILCLVLFYLNECTHTHTHHSKSLSSVHMFVCVCVCVK